MHAFLLINPDTRAVNSDPYKFAQKMNAKVVPFTLQKIEDVRDLKKLIKFSFSEKTAILIKDIDKITIEAANAFLKNLEEPNNNLIYILTAINLSNVLPTIVSRCEIVRTTMVNSRPSTVSRTVNYKDALNIKDRDEAIKFVENYLLSIEPELTHNPQLTTACQTCLITIRNLKANGNVSLQLTDFVVMLNQ